MSRNILSQFEKFKKLLDSDYVTKYNFPGYFSYEDFSKKLYKPTNLQLKDNSNQYDSLFFEANQNYIYSFLLCMSYATETQNEILTFASEDFTERSWYFSFENRMRLKMSTLYSYIFPPIPFIINDRIMPTLDDIENDHIIEKDLNTQSKQINHNIMSQNENPIQESISYKRVVRRYYNKLYNVSNALQLYIKYCPYATYIPEPEPEYSRNFDESFSKDFKEIKQSTSPLPLVALQPYLLKLLHYCLPLKFLNQYRIAQQNIMLNNENFTPTRIRHFYKKYYSAITLDNAYKNTPSQKQVLFDYFVSEWLLNGTFIFYCLDVFASSKAINIQKEVPNIATTLFHNLNKIDNFFLRRVLLDFFMESYYTPYSYKDKDYQEGKISPKEWIQNITTQIIPCIIKETQEMLYSFCCATISKPLPTKEIGNIRQYFNMPIVTHASKHRTKTAENLTLDFISDYYSSFLSFGTEGLKLTHLPLDTDGDN